MLSFNTTKAPEEVRSFFSCFQKQEHETLTSLLVTLAVKTLRKYKKLELNDLKKLISSSEVIGKTEENVEKLQNMIKTLQNSLILMQEGLEKPKTFEKSTGMSPLCCITNQESSRNSRRAVKKVDFWNQTDEKENFEPSKSTRTTWNRNTEINWVHDFSKEVKKLPKGKSPLVIRESRISILSNQTKSKYSSIDEFF
jgi:hypothetical protein